MGHRPRHPPSAPGGVPWPMPGGDRRVATAWRSPPRDRDRRRHGPDVVTGRLRRERPAGILGDAQRAITIQREVVGEGEVRRRVHAGAHVVVHVGRTVIPTALRLAQVGRQHARLLRHRDVQLRTSSACSRPLERSPRRSGTNRKMWPVWFSLMPYGVPRESNRIPSCSRKPIAGRATDAPVRGSISYTCPPLASSAARSVFHGVHTIPSKLRTRRHRRRGPRDGAMRRVGERALAPRGPGGRAPVSCAVRLPRGRVPSARPHPG